MAGGCFNIYDKGRLEQERDRPFVLRGYV